MQWTWDGGDGGNVASLLQHLQIAKAAVCPLLFLISYVKSPLFLLGVSPMVSHALVLFLCHA